MATLNLDVSEDFQKSFEAMLKDLAQNVLDEVAADPLQKKEYLNKREACEFLGISFVTLQKLELMGLPVIRIENRMLISKETLKSFMKSLEK